MTFFIYGLAMLRWLIWLAILFSYLKWIMYLSVIRLAQAYVAEYVAESMAWPPSISSLTST